MRRIGAQRRQRGFLIIAGIFLLVVLAGLVAYLMTGSTTSQAASAADFNSARAFQAARAGIEWGSFQIIRNSGGSFATSTCTGGAPAQVDLTFAGTALANFTARVTCTSTVGVTEGGVPVTAYRITSNGCNLAVCPTVTSSATYVERELSLSITN
jgi:MSHA biogenesis protein MshP